MRRLFCLFWIPCLLAACGASVESDYDGMEADTAEEDGTSEELQLDVPDVPAEHMDVPHESGRICTIDLVFCVDNSTSMQEEIRAFREDVWPFFAQALIEVSGGVDGSAFRAAVLDACPEPANFHTRGRDGECSFESGEVWMASDSSDLVGEFQCVGDIYTGDAECSGSNDDEQPATVAAISLEPPWHASSRPNGGFMRDEALLIVIAITDEDEHPVPSASPGDIYERLIAAKDGDVSKMIFLGIGGRGECEGSYGRAHESVMLMAITDYFIAEDRGIFWDLCGGRLEDGLTEAMDVISDACDEIFL